MAVSRLMKSWFTGAIVAVVALQGASAQGPQRGGTPQTDKVPPVNTGANPYRVIRDWAQLTIEARPWGGSNGVAVDKDGKSVWATDRCSPGTAPGCLGTRANPVHLFDETGKEVRSFGGGMFVWPHGVHVDRDGNVWVTDARAASPDELAKFPVRKQTFHGARIRLVEVVGFDVSTCGGTHAHRAGEVGLIAVKGVEKSKAHHRVEFVCGGRALREYEREHSQFCAGLQQFCSERAIGYFRADTAVPFDELVLRIFRAGGFLS